MKIFKTILFGIIIFISNNLFASNAKTTLSGKIIDKETKETLIGVNVYIPDLKTGTVTDINGNYKIENLPSSKILVQVSFIGYKTIIETIDLSTTTTKDFAMESSVKEINEVVVTGISAGTEKNRTATPITVVPKTVLLQNSSTNIIDAVASQPGVSQVTTGVGISKPVIRGLGYNRVLVINDGIRQEGQQWGDEHGIEIDEYAVDKVEILKGPASLAYGSDAMAGVINMISAPTLSEGTIKGNILGNYQTNNGLIGYSGNVAGNVKGLIWDVRYSNKMAHAYQNKYDGYVFNSGFKENNLGGIIGVNKSWGYSHLHFGIYNLTPGIVEGERDSATGKFIKPVAINDSTADDEIATDKDFKSYSPFIPYQKIHHYKAVLNNNFIIGNGTLKATFGWQQNQRQEYPDVLQPNQYGLYFFLNTINYDVRYLFPEKNNWSISLGINGMEQTNQNKGIEFLIPEYSLFDIGGFIYAKKNFGKLELSGGIRYDVRNIHSKELMLDIKGEPTTSNDSTNELLFEKFSRNFSSVSESIGGSYSVTNNFILKLNLSRGFRAPNMTELAANGVHEGTFQFIKGKENLEPETSFQIDAGLVANSHHVTFEMNLFSNTINNFIYLHKLSSISGGDSLSEAEGEYFQTFSYSQGKANLFGGEMVLDIHPHPLDWLHFENSFSYVEAIQLNATDSTKYLPFTPAPKFSSDLKADIKKIGKVLGNSYVKIGMDYFFTQDKFYSAFSTETETPGYALLNVGLGTDFVSKGKTFCSFYFSVNNLTDVAYQSHLNRLKNAAENNVTGRTGVYNMGRNISLKIVVPFEASLKKKE